MSSEKTPENFTIYLNIPELWFCILNYINRHMLISIMSAFYGMNMIILSSMEASEAKMITI